jgi:hypothetical protein
MLRSNPLRHSTLKPADWVVYAPSRRVIVIAAKNQTGSIAGQIQRYIGAGDLVIVVDEWSTDGTPQTAEAAGAMVIRTDKTAPFSSAIRHAVRLAATLGSEVLVIRG